MPSEQTLAKEFNVCRMTVNRALKQLETEGLVYPRRGVGRFVGKSRRVRHKRIGVAIYDIGHAANPAMAEVLGGLRETIRAAGYDMIIYASEESHRHVGDAQLMSSVYASVVDAVVVLHQSIERSHLEQISQEVPMLVVNLPAAGLPVHRVETDLAGGGFMVGRRLSELGHRQIAVINGEDHVFSVQQLETGLALAYQAAGVTLDRELIRRGVHSQETGYASTKNLLASGRVFTAIVCGDDDIAVGAIHALQESGLVVPDDVSVVGFNDVPIAKVVRPTLTTVRVPSYELGCHAGRLLLQACAGNGQTGQGEHVKLPCQFVERESTAPANRRRVEHVK